MYGGKSVQGRGPGKSCCQCPVLTPPSPWCPARMFHHVPEDCCCPHFLAGRSLQHPVLHESKEVSDEIWKVARMSVKMNLKLKIGYEATQGREAAGF